MNISHIFTSIFPFLPAQYTNAIFAVIVFVVGLLIAKAVAVVVKRRMYGKYSNNVTNITSRFVYYGIVVIAVVAGFAELGISIGSALVAGGFLGIVIGLAAQSSVSNLIAGILLIVDKPFKVGDFVTYGDITAGIIEIGFLSTKVATWEGVPVRIPNGQLFNSNVYNYTKAVARMVRTQITLIYEEDMDRVMKAVTDAFKEQWYVLVEPAPTAFPIQFTDSGIIIEVRVWTTGANWGDLYFAMPRIIAKTMKRMNVKFAYPKRVYLESGQGKPSPMAKEQKKSLRESEA
ncbi:MAG: mechanosensitive ion channel family protein [Candidatus Micrarchaeota archaeon]|nr:mechanosensitive ion channel family protein [Candidatus Micrarchaeota archaeon]